MVSVPCVVEVQPILKECLKLNAEQSAFREKTSLLLDESPEVAEVKVFRLWEHYSFTEQRAVFRASDVERVGEFRDVVNGHVRGFGGESCCESCSVDEEPESVLFAHGLDCA